MKNTLYFREDLQELKTLPIEESNCYYIGEFTNRQMLLIEKYLTKRILSFDTLIKLVNEGKFR